MAIQTMQHLFRSETILKVPINYFSQQIGTSFKGGLHYYGQEFALYQVAFDAATMKTRIQLFQLGLSFIINSVLGEKEEDVGDDWWCTSR